MQTVRKPRLITQEEKSMLLHLDVEDITIDLLKDFFAYKKNTDAKFNPNDHFLLNKGEFYNSEQCRTSVGRFIYNLFILSPKLITLLGYQNEDMTDGNIGKLEGKLSKLLLNDKITSEDMFTYYDKSQWLGFTLAKFLNASLTYDLLVPTDNINNKKQELIKKYERDIEKGDVIKVAALEKELIDFAKNDVKDVPDMQIYNSGGRGSFGNNYKNTSLLRGSMKNLADPTKIHVSTSSLVEGIDGEEMAYYADLITQASYSRAVGTREGGYEGKKLMAAFQSVVIDEKDSDCGTHLTLKTEITKDNSEMFMYRYIVENGKLVQLNDDNIKKYIGKFVNLRSPMYCKGDKICNKCAGDLYYKLGIKTPGLIANRVGSSLLNSSLKAFHNMTLKTIKINVDDYLK